MKGSWVLQRAESNRGLSTSSFLGNERTRSEEVVERRGKKHEPINTELCYGVGLSTGYGLANPWRPWRRCLKGISAPTKVGRKQPAVLHRHPHHWAKVLPMDVYVARAWVPGTLLRWHHTQNHSGTWRWKQGAQSGPEVGHGRHTCRNWLTRHRTAHSWNRDRWGPNLWSNSQEVCYTHIAKKGQFLSL